MFGRGCSVPARPRPRAPTLTGSQTHAHLPDLRPTWRRSGRAARLAGEKQARPPQGAGGPFFAAGLAARPPPLGLASVVPSHYPTAGSLELHRQKPATATKNTAPRRLAAWFRSVSAPFSGLRTSVIRQQKWYAPLRHLPLPFPNPLHAQELGEFLKHLPRCEFGRVLRSAFVDSFPRFDELGAGKQKPGGYEPPPPAPRKLDKNRRPFRVEV